MATKKTNRKSTNVGTKKQSNIGADVTPRAMTRDERQNMWKLIEDAFAVKPKDVNQQNTLLTIYYRDELINLAKGRFKINCPDWWDVDCLLDYLLIDGVFYITNSPVGVAPFKGTAHDLNIFNRPSRVTITNPLLPTFERTITGEKADAVQMFLYRSRDIHGIMNIVDFYAGKLASIDASLDVNLMNTRAAYVFNVKNNKQAESAKLFYDKISRGEPAVFLDMEDALNMASGSHRFVETMPVQQNYIADKLMELKQNIKNDFLARIGLNSTPYEKRERLLTDEVNSNNAEISAYVDYPRYNLERQSEKVRAMFGIDFSLTIKEEQSYDTARLDDSGNDVPSQE